MKRLKLKLKKIIEHGRFDIIDDLEKYCVNKHLIYHDTFTDFINNAEPSRRQLIFTMTKFTIIILHIVKDTMFSVYNNEDLMTQFGDPFHLVFKNVLYIYAVYVSISLISLFGHVLILSMEVKGNSSMAMIFQVMLDMKSSKPFYRMDRKHEKRLMNRSRVLFDVFKLFGNFANYFIGIPYLGLAWNAYFNHGDKYNLVTIALSFSMGMIWLDHMKSIVVFVGMYFYIPISFFIYKLEEICG